MANLTDPQVLANLVQRNVDSIAGKHIDLASFQLLANILHDLDVTFIAVTLISIVAIIIVTRFASHIVDRMLINYIPKIAAKIEVLKDETIQLVIHRLVSAAIYILGAMLIIFQIPQLSSLATTILASAGIASLAIGLAAKDSLSNFVSSIFIFIFQPFRMGDFIDFKGDYGQIEDITLRHTIIRTSDNRRIIVPNSIMSAEPIINWSIKELEITWSVDFDLKNASDIDRARDIIIEKARAHTMVLKDRPISVLLVDSKHSELTLRLEVAVPGRSVAKKIGCDILEAAKKEFEVQGISPSSLV